VFKMVQFTSSLVGFILSSASLSYAGVLQRRGMFLVRVNMLPALPI
jgi:hypothetical protein